MAGNAALKDGIKRAYNLYAELHRIGGAHTLGDPGRVLYDLTYQGTTAKHDLAPELIRRLYANLAAAAMRGVPISDPLTADCRALHYRERA